MHIELISTGDEILSGFVTDTNQCYLAQKLLAKGLYITQKHCVSDKLKDIEQILYERSILSDLIIVTGGLGPTDDDNTAAAASLAARQDLILNYEHYDHLDQWLQERKARGFEIRPKLNLKQCLIPRQATRLDNPHGSACPFYLYINKALCFFLPGVPSEMKEIYELFVEPLIFKLLKIQEQIAVKTYYLHNCRESLLNESLIEHKLIDDTIRIGYRAHFPILDLKLIYDKNIVSIESFKSYKDKVEALIKDDILYEDEHPLHSLAQRHKDDILVIADDFSNGYLSYRLSSAYKKIYGTLHLDFDEDMHIQDESKVHKLKLTIKADKVFLTASFGAKEESASYSLRVKEQYSVDDFELILIYATLLLLKL